MNKQYVLNCPSSHSRLRRLFDSLLLCFVIRVMLRVDAELHYGGRISLLVVSHADIYSNLVCFISVVTFFVLAGAAVTTTENGIGKA